MNKFLLILLFTFSTSTFAKTKSMWCSDSNYGTPTEALASGTVSSLLIMDKVNEDEIQITIQDLVRPRTEIFKAKLGVKTRAHIFDFAIGNYLGDRTVSITVENGKIQVQLDLTTYNCEIRDYYKTNYTNNIIF